MHRSSLFASAQASFVIVLCAAAVGCGDGATDGSGGDSSSSGQSMATAQTGTSGTASTGSGSSSSGPPPCESQPDDYCEASGGAHCYYLDPNTGSDETGDGSSTKPWRSFANINVSIYTSFRPPTWVPLAPGDVVYLRSGTYSDIYHPGDDGGPDGGGSFLIYDRGLDGASGQPITFKAFPGNHPILDPQHVGRGIYLEGCTFIDFEHIEIQNALDRGLVIAGSDSVHARRLNIHDTDGSEDDNIAGVELNGVGSFELVDSLLHDNYDRTAAAAGTQSENSRNMVMFGGSGAISIHRNVFYQSNPYDGESCGAGLVYKHSAGTGASIEVFDNYFENHKYEAIGMGTHHVHAHHNVIVGSEVAIYSKDFGGPTHQNDQVFENNSVYGARGLMFDGTLDYVAQGGAWPGLTDNAWKNNVVYDTTPVPNQDRRTMAIGTYLDQSVVDQTVQGLSVDGNCYFASAGQATFSVHEQALGVIHFAEWKSQYGFDATGLEADPQFVAGAAGDLTLAAGSPCTGKGAFEGGHAPPAKDFDPFACK